MINRSESWLIAREQRNQAARSRREPRAAGRNQPCTDDAAADAAAEPSGETVDNDPAHYDSGGSVRHLSG